MRCVLPRALLVMLALAPLTACGSPEDEPRTLACGIAPLVFDPNGDVVQGERAAVCARVERRAVPLSDGYYMCMACPYDPLRLVVHAPGVDIDVGAAALSYQASHHNWADTIEATVDGATTRVRILYDTKNGGWDLELTLNDQDDALLLPVVAAR